MDWNRRISSRCVWPALVIMTVVLCICFAFISFSFETDYSPVFGRLKNENPQSEKLTDQDCVPVCDSKDCVLQSKILLQHVQPSFSPCDDFYKFACGTHLGNHFEAESIITRGLKIMRIKLRSILENLEPIPNTTSEKLKILYDSCTKQSSEIQAVPTLLKILDEIGLENWPNMNPDFKFENIPLTKVIANLLVYDEYGFVMFDRYSDKEILSLSTGESPYERSSLHTRKFQIDRILNYFKFDDEEIISIQEDSRAMQTAIEHLRQESLRAEEEGVTTLSRDVNCSVDMEYVDFCEVLDFFVDTAKVNEEVSKKLLTIEASDIYFVQNIFLLLRNFTDRSIANYLAINVIMNHLNDLNTYLRLTYLKGVDDISKLEGTVSHMERWQYCVDSISIWMVIGLAHEYMKKAFTLAMLDELEDFTDETIHETAEYFSRQEWVSENLREGITEKIRNIVQETPLRKKVSAENFLDKGYKPFKPEEGSSFLRNIIEFRKFQKIEEIRRHPIKDISRYFSNIFFPGASGGGGYLRINLGILFPPIYSPTVERIFNTASLGMVILHEIGHNLFHPSNTMQFNQEEKDYYEAKVKCIADQVSQYRFELLEKNANGSQYSNEDIADNVAASVFDKLIEKYLSEGNEKFLPGLDYSTKQLLYTSSALTWCSVTSKEKEELEYRVSTHSPDKFRLYQLMKNSRGFSEAFRCPVGSFLNPEDKCLLLTEGGTI